MLVLEERQMGKIEHDNPDADVKSSKQYPDNHSPGDLCGTVLLS